MSNHAEKYKPHSHRAVNVNDLHQYEHETAGFNKKLAVTITKGFGSIWAFYILIAWMLLWMALASAGVWLFALDKYPFSFLLFLSNLVQLWALPVLAVGTSVLGRKQELMAEEQFHTSQKTFQDVETLIKQNNLQLELLEMYKELLENHYKELSKHTDLLAQALKPFTPRRRPMRQDEVKE